MTWSMLPQYIATNWEQIGATIISGFTFVKAHGGVRTMWGDFMGPAGSKPSGIKAGDMITQVTKPTGNSGNG